MSAIERGLYVAVGAADLAVEKVQELPVVKTVVEQTKQLRQKSIIDQAREIEPRLRKQAKDLSTRGEKVVKRVQKDAKQFQKQVREFPTEARKQVATLRTDARKQVKDIRGRFEKAVGRGNGSAPAKPASKTSAKAESKVS